MAASTERPGPSANSFSTSRQLTVVFGALEPIAFHQDFRDV
jgi:hypothetical protein